MDNYDNELVEKVLDGETEAFRIIVDRHKAKIFYLGLKFFHNDEDAEDFAQEVFLRTFKKLGSFLGNVPFGAWLYRIAFNCAVNKYHFDHRRLTVPEEPIEPAEYLYEEYTGPEKALMDDELRTNMNEALSKLPDAYSIVIRMHYYDRLSYGEISEITDIPVNTIKSHISRAKKLIKKMIEPQV
jgi:RNA polymerase sigma-70 factor (ECF subfamily)